MRFTPNAPRRAFHSRQGRENAGAPKEYAQVKGTVAQVTDGAVLFTNEKVTPAVWVPLWSLDLGGKLAAAKAHRGSEIEMGVELKIALAKGLV
jgi:hypothetical protein